MFEVQEDESTVTQLNKSLWYSLDPHEINLVIMLSFKHSTQNTSEEDHDPPHSRSEEDCDPPHSRSAENCGGFWRILFCSIGH